MPDHIHILMRWVPTGEFISFMRDLKGHSSGWLHETFPRLREFRWQKAYGAFGVGESEVAGVSHYIRNQQEHHKSRSFQEEFRALLDAHNVPYDEKYLWD